MLTKRNFYNSYISQLNKTNAAIWEIETNIRNLERLKSFGKEFVEVARSVYRTNDKRAALKRQINELLDSKIKRNATPTTSANELLRHGKKSRMLHISVCIEGTK